MRSFFLTLPLALLLLATGCERSAPPIRVGSKTFTESVLLGEMAVQLLQDDGLNAVHQRELNGTRVLWEAMLAGQIDAYPDYTGTLANEILKRPDLQSDGELRKALADLGIGMTASIGFNDTYAIGVKADVADRLGLRTISDLQKRPELRFGFSNEFMDRKDGWPLLRDRYGLAQRSVTGLDHDLAYRAIDSGSIDATDLYSTDAEIAFYHLRILEDDRKVFPAYRAVFVYRLATPPAVVRCLQRLQGVIDEPTMIGLNARVKLQKEPEPQVAADFLGKSLHVATRVQQSSLAGQIWQRTVEHLTLVTVSLSAAVVVGIGGGLLCARRRVTAAIVVGIVAAIYTIPSLALLVVLIRPLGIGSGSAIVALFLYSLLPILRNTVTGLNGISASLRESAEVMGLSRSVILRRIELPLAMPVILAGIKTAAVINVGTATLGAVIGAGGYGQLIVTGMRLDNWWMILAGVIPSAAMALAAQGLFTLLERWVVPRGLHIRVAAHAPAE